MATRKYQGLGRSRVKLAPSTKWNNERSAVVRGAVEQSLVND